MQTPIAQVRSFNRTIAASIGALDARFLGLDRPMGEARLLWEIGDGADVRDLRRRLALDSGYTSRLLRSLERRGLVQRGVASRDRRGRRVEPTSAGRQEQARLEERSDAFASSLLAGLPADEAAHLVTAMRLVERLMVRAQTSIAPEPAASVDVRWCFGQAVAEFQARFEGGFDPGRSVRADPVDLTPPAGLVLVARHRGAPVGCGALKLVEPTVADIKRMWVAPHVRGHGLGPRLLAELEDQAVRAGATTARLETNRALTEAIALYRRSGYTEVPPFSAEPYAHHWFQKTLQRSGDPAPQTG